MILQHVFFSITSEYCLYSPLSGDQKLDAAGHERCSGVRPREMETILHAFAHVQPNLHIFLCSNAVALKGMYPLGEFQAPKVSSRKEAFGISPHHLNGSSQTCTNYIAGACPSGPGKEDQGWEEQWAIGSAASADTAP